PLADEARGQGYATAAETSDDDGRHGPGPGLARAAESSQMDGPVAVVQTPEGQTKGTLAQCVSEHRQKTRTHAQHGAKADTQNDVTDLPDAGVGKQALDVALVYGNRRRDQYRDHRQHHQNVSQGHGVEGEGDAENGQYEAQQHIDGHLGGGGGDEGR